MPQIRCQACLSHRLAAKQLSWISDAHGMVHIFACGGAFLSRWLPQLKCESYEHFQKVCCHILGCPLGALRFPVAVHAGAHSRAQQRGLPPQLSRARPHGQPGQQRCSCHLWGGLGLAGGSGLQAAGRLCCQPAPRCLLSLPCPPASARTCINGLSGLSSHELDCIMRATSYALLKDQSKPESNPRRLPHRKW